MYTILTLIIKYLQRIVNKLDLSGQEKHGCGYIEIQVIIL